MEAPEEIEWKKAVDAQEAAGKRMKAARAECERAEQQFAEATERYGEAIAKYRAWERKGRPFKAPL